ncbi:MAG: hypothetical protein AMXMBFR84_11520 [Candidatus Hydrogenedentota bacterium]
MIQVTCPRCGLIIRVPRTVQGRTGVCFQCGSSLTVPSTEKPLSDEDIAFDTGRRISDRYVIEQVIGAGGMGVVYRAHDALMHERVALKFLNPKLLRTQKGVQLFIQEAQRARRLRHDNIVGVHDVGSTPEGILYISMEFVRGNSLRKFLRQKREERKLLDIRFVVDITSQVLAALDYAHRYVVHRDIKPENVMLLTGERAKVLDFGLAKAIDEENLRPSPLDEIKHNRVVGTEAYAAPEQRFHEDVDLRADIFATGLLFHELLTLRTPLDPPIDVEKARTDVSPSLVRVRNKALNEAKEDRWQTAAEFRDALLAAYEESYKRTVTVQRPDDAEETAVSLENMVFMEGGSFLMGNHQFPDEAPAGEGYVQPYYIDQAPVTNAQYAEFMKATGHSRPKYWGAREFDGPDQPVVSVSFADAMAYARWAGKQLPTEVQWEFAARGKENRKYPWGTQEPDSHKANYGDFLNMPSIVTMHDEGRTKDGLYDMAGNVYEWTTSLFLPYDPAKREAAQQQGAAPQRVVRGGSWHSPANELRCSFRKGLFEESQLPTVGFRCVVPASRVQG